MSHCDCNEIMKNPTIMKDKVEVYIFDSKTNKMEKKRQKENIEKKIKKKVIMKK